MAKGALGKDPKFVVSDDAAQRARQLNKWQLLAKQGDKSAKANIAAIKAYKAPVTADPAATPAATDPQTEQYNGIINQAGGVQSGLLDQAAGRGDFNPQTMGIQQFQPGDFQQQFQGAYDSAMNQFNRSAQPAFDQQNKDYQQMAAERGWDPNSEVAQRTFKQLQDNQNNARLNAQDAAYQTGLGAQNQAYQQASNTYGQNLTGQGQQFGQAQTQFQMPFSNLSALSPYLQAQYGQQSAQQLQGYGQENAAQAQEYAKELAALQQKYTMTNNKFAVANRAPPGGGGGSQGLTLADQMALQNNGFYNNMMLASLGGSQNQYPNAANSALSGIANGVSLGVTNSILK